MPGGPSSSETSLRVRFGVAEGSSMTPLCGCCATARYRIGPQVRALHFLAESGRSSPGSADAYEPDQAAVLCKILLNGRQSRGGVGSARHAVVQAPHQRG